MISAFHYRPTIGSRIIILGRIYQVLAAGRAFISATGRRIRADTTAVTEQMMMAIIRPPLASRLYSTVTAIDITSAAMLALPENYCKCHYRQIRHAASRRFRCIAPREVSTISRHYGPHLALTIVMMAL